MKGKELKSEIELFVIDKVKEMRLKANISQAQLAIKLDVSVGFIGHVESPNKSVCFCIFPLLSFNPLLFNFRTACLTLNNL